MVVSQQGQGVDAVTPAVIDACRRGDREAFRTLYDAYKDKVYSMSLYFFHGDEAAAADLTQQVFLKLMTSIGQFRGDARFSTWLYRLVVNLCLDGSRRLKAAPISIDPDVLDRVAGGESQEEVFVRNETAARVQAAVSALTPKIRAVVLLRYFEELSYADMAGVLECSIGTVASRLSRAHDVLAATLGPVMRTKRES